MEDIENKKIQDDSKCSMLNCPMQYDTIVDCLLTHKDCMFFSPKVDYEKLYKNICKDIAHCIVEELKKQGIDSIN